MARRAEIGEVLPWVVLGGAVWIAAKFFNLGTSAGNEGHYTPPPPGQVPTLSDTVLANLADRIYSGTWAGWIFAEDEDAITSALLQLGNDADYSRLANIYGTRRGPFILDASLDLVQSVQYSLSNSELADLNNKLAQKGLHVRF